MNKVTKDWFIKASWGNIAVVSWGDPANQPVLLVHGYMDSAATFISLVKILPDEYYYVGIDLPGHGYSDPFPPGPLVTHAHMLEVIRRVVEHMAWEQFIYMSHSLGFLMGVFYNVVFPNKIYKMVNIDPGPTLPMFYYTTHGVQYWMQFAYNEYYENYKKLNLDPPKLYTYEQAVNAIVRTRHISEKQAEVVLSRCLVPNGDGLYRLSWEPRMKRFSGIPITGDTLLALTLTNPPPMLSIFATEREGNTEPFEVFTEEFFSKMKSLLKNYRVETVRGCHDVHITDPEVIAEFIVDFLSSNVLDGVKAKL